MGSAALLLVACAPIVRGSGPTAPSRPASPVALPAEAPPPVEAGPDGPSPRGIAAVTPAAPPPPPPPRSRDLIGLDGTEVTRRLGKPALAWREPPAVVWQYPGPACVLHVFLYAEAGAVTVRHVEARATRETSGVTGPDGCYADLVAANKTRRAEG